MCPFSVPVQRRSYSNFNVCSNLTISIDLEFYDSWNEALDHAKATLSPDLRSNYAHHVHSTFSTSSLQPTSYNRRSCPSSNQTHITPTAPLHALSTILIHSAPFLRSFSFVMHSGPGSAGSAWSQFPKPGMSGISFADALVDDMKALWENTLEHADIKSAFASLPPREILGFPQLTSFAADGTADIASFLTLAPNLANIRLRIPEGFNAKDSAIIVDSLTSTPNLKSLEIWIWELGHSAQRIDLLSKIGRSCPHLESLNFQTRSFDYADGGMKLRPVPEKGFTWKVCTGGAGLKFHTEVFPMAGHARSYAFFPLVEGSPSTWYSV